MHSQWNAELDVPTLYYRWNYIEASRKLHKFLQFLCNRVRHLQWTHSIKKRKKNHVVRKWSLNYGDWHRWEAMQIWFEPIIIVHLKSLQLEYLYFLIFHSIRFDSREMNSCKIGQIELQSDVCVSSNSSISLLHITTICTVSSVLRAFEFGLEGI